MPEEHNCIKLIDFEKFGNRITNLEDRVSKVEGITDTVEGIGMNQKFIISRLENVETTSIILIDLNASVKVLTSKIETMTINDEDFKKALKEANEEIGIFKNKGSVKWDGLTEKVLYLIIGGIVSTMVLKLLSLILI